MSSKKVQEGVREAIQEAFRLPSAEKKKALTLVLTLVITLALALALALPLPLALTLLTLKSLPSTLTVKGASLLITVTAPCIGTPCWNPLTLKRTWDALKSQLGWR